ncbi:hypothetical protein [Bifidobacterium biavatii]|uniref:Uncharacterized protein n=1 Tax=Bifidobacterium biavatii DSM 23969 TaxID=1437608 RepID=A0A086ZDA2_9BIFI|nr:hypothetical protein [Bifidobacterium biavatii]KFI44502.1 hypothetical protein BBIA_2410 [Bifidobacterium biavatii DSM 23969]
MTSLDSTALGEVIVRVTRKWVFDETGADLTPGMVETLIERIGRVQETASMLSLIDSCRAVDTDPAARELLRLLACEDPTGRPFDQHRRRACEDHLTMAAGLIARLTAARYGYDERVEREAIRLRLADDPRYARTLLMESLDVIEMVLELQYASAERRREATAR